MESDRDKDVQAIRSLVARQFNSISWREGETPDWAAFERDFLPDAALYASARPLRSQTTGQFIERMSGLVGKTLHSFEETVLGSRIHVFGNVAVAVIACENVENGMETNRNVEMMLLVKDEGVWRIAAQAWDRQDAANPVTSQVWEPEGRSP
ncbi:conserved hypothetical protein (plasmid) [Sinorhizobium fredii NGR234]|uniref:DUF4440 domain-containing protein n=1 Tax=Sinorhizobium fredii (strain NBRC 101917 / NGR234) TaxID=394 RepID=C3KKF5_SINFN|nr:nuclear transport factor 2 family protein [Sinorhizobium fredii]ACP22891.1 conserved hypothetical protein [Sinorhizobium fredii NGR234]